MILWSETCLPAYLGANSVVKLKWPKSGEMSIKSSLEEYLLEYQVDLKHRKRSQFIHFEKDVYSAVSEFGKSKLKSPQIIKRFSETLGHLEKNSTLSFRQSLQVHIH